MSFKTLDIELGDLRSPAQVAQYLPGNNAKRVREMCASGELGCTVVTGPNGQPRYWISDGDIRAWRKKHQQRAA